MQSKMYVRHTIMDSPLPYRVWLSFNNILHGKQRVTPKQGDDLYLDAYPRSGNTYFTSALKYCCPDLRFANHLHLIAPIKIALANDLPTFILVRDPREAVLSNIIQKSWATSPPEAILHSRGLEMISDYVRYYEFVLEHAEQIYVIDSDCAFKSPFAALRRVLDILKIPREPHLNLRWDEFHREFTRRDQTKAQGSTSYPSDARQALKKRLGTTLSESRFRAAQDIFERLRGAAVNAPS